MAGPEATPAAGPVVPQQAVPASGPEAATQGVPVSGSSTAPERTSEEVPAVSGEASGEHALVPRQGGRRAAVPQSARSGGAVVFGPQTQEEAAMDAVSRRLRGRTDRIEAFAQAEVERTRELERVVLVSSLSAFQYFFLCSFFFSGGALAHPLGVAPEVRVNYVVVGSDLLERWPCFDFCLL